MTGYLRDVSSGYNLAAVGISGRGMSSCYHLAPEQDSF